MQIDFDACKPNIAEQTSYLEPAYSSLFFFSTMVNAMSWGTNSLVKHEKTRDFRSDFVTNDRHFEQLGTPANKF